MCLKDAVREAINAYVLAIRIKRCPDDISTVTGAERLERLERLIHVFSDIRFTGKELDMETLIKMLVTLLTYRATYLPFCFHM